MSKKLFILIGDSGDGSYFLNYTFNEEWIKKEAAEGEYNEYRPGWDGDGFSYKVLTVPDDSTYESLGISKYSIVDESD